MYFDAFENDYQADPFLAISSQIYSLIENSDEDTQKEFKEKATAAFRVLGRVALRVGAKKAADWGVDGTAFEDSGAPDEASDLIDGLIEQRLTQASEDKKCLKVFQKYLGTLAQSLGDDKQLVFIIDELDRCKPTFALSILESIKHLFSVPNICFVLVMNRRQIEESVRKEYGSGVQATKYLQKFVTIWVHLPKETLKGKNVAQTYLRECFRRMGYRPSDHVYSLYDELIAHYDMSLREVEKSLSNFAIGFNLFPNFYESQMLLNVFVSIVKVVRHDTFVKLLDRSISYSELLSEADLVRLNDEDWTYMESHPLKWLLLYNMGTDSDIEALKGDGEPAWLQARPNSLESVVNRQGSFDR